MLAGNGEFDNLVGVDFAYCGMIERGIVVQTK
jgi:hypothetical protein